MGVCENAPEEYCGHVLEPEEGEADRVWHEMKRNAVCLRDPKYEGLCVWHADTKEKNVDELVEARLTPDDVPWEADYVKEHLSGTILRGIEFPPGFSFDRCVLVLAEFHNADFPLAGFHDAYLRDANFHDARLHSANFHDSDLYNAKFHGGYLHSANFHDADLPLAEFHDAYLRDAEFPDADLPLAEFHEAYLRDAELPDAGLSDAEFHDAGLFNAEFQRADLRRAEFQRADLPNVVFHDANLQHAEFPDSDLSNAEFHDASLFNAKFPRADLHNAEFPRSDLDNAEFPRSDLDNAEFLRTNLRGIDLTEATLRETNFSEANLREAIFRPAYSRRVVSEDTTTSDPLGASLEDAQFEDGTDLRGADLSGARLYQAGFRDVRINDETTFGIEEGRYGETCRYEYDPNTGVSTNEDVPRLRAASWTYRRLESLFEENAMDERARNAHIRKEEAQRAYYGEQIEDDEWIDEDEHLSDSWLKSLGEYAVRTANWYLHRHGESLRRLLGVSGLLILFCGAVYAGGGIARENPEATYRITLADLTNPVATLVDLLNGLYFSVITFSTIGYGDFYPASPLSRLLVGIESLAGALFTAMFVFVIGRRVAR